MKITAKPSAFRPVTITLETKEELICMRAVVDAAKNGRPIAETFMQQRDYTTGRPFIRDAEEFARALDREICQDDYN